jgi:hypothetical protein
VREERRHWDGGCWFVRFADTPCDGRLVRCHLISRQQLRRAGYPELVEDPRTWVPGCGGPTGIGGHHGQLDFSRTLRVPLFALPTATLLLAEEIGLDWWLEREYG